MEKTRTHLEHTLTGIVLVALIVTPLAVLISHLLSDFIRYHVFFIIHPVILAVAVIPFYRALAAARVHAIEERILPIPVIFTSLLVPLAAAAVFTEYGTTFIVLGIPGILALFTFYVFLMLDFFVRRTDRDMLISANIHTGFAIHYFSALMVLQLVFLLVLLANGAIPPDEYTLVWISAFLAEIICVIYLKNILFMTVLRQQGYLMAEDTDTKAVFSAGSAGILIAALGTVAVVRLPDLSRFAERIIRWISSLRRPGPGIASPERKRPPTADPESIQRYGDFIMKLRNQMEAQISPFWREFWEHMMTILIVVSLVIVVFLVIYPALSLILRSNDKPITFREYYAAVVDLIVRIGRSILSIFTGHGAKSAGTREMRNRSSETGLTGRTVTGVIRKKKLKQLLALYIRVLRWARRKKGTAPDSAHSVREMFADIAAHHPDKAKEAARLSELFNTGFFSRVGLSAAEYDELKSLAHSLMRHRATKRSD